MVTRTPLTGFPEASLTVAEVPLYQVVPPFTQVVPVAGGVPVGGG